MTRELTSLKNNKPRKNQKIAKNGVWRTMRLITVNLSHSERSISNSSMVGYPSVMQFEYRLASGPEEICDLFAEFSYTTNTYRWCMTHLLARFNSLQMRSKAFCSTWKSTRVPAYHRSFWRTVHLLSQNFFLTGLWQWAFFQTGGRFHELLRHSRKVGVTTLKTIVVWQYYLQFQSDLNCWFIDECITTWRILCLSINMASWRTDRR
jgi:hypothetical protein